MGAQRVRVPNLSLLGAPCPRVFAAGNGRRLFSFTHRI